MSLRQFDSYTPRRLSTLGRGYSLFVTILKFSLPLLALAIIGVLIARLAGDPPQKLATFDNLRAAPANNSSGAAPAPNDTGAAPAPVPGQIELEKARYEGMDDEQNPYTVTADRAVRAMDAPDTVLFDNPMADITLQDKTWVAVRAKSGSFDRAGEHLDLKGDVAVFHDSGYEMQVQDMAIDLKKKTAETSLSVKAQGPMGAIAAQNMRVQDQGNLIVFGGPATLTIFRLAAKKESRG